jgi:TP901 family phage tail tape measure protein
MTSFIIPSVFKAVDQTTGVVRKIGSSVHAVFSSLENRVARGERMFRKLTPALGETATQMLSFAKAAAIAGVLISTINFSANALLQYEDALASTQAVTGTSNQEFLAFRNQISLVANDTRKSAVDVAKSFEIIGSAKPELLASADALGAVTKASIILSKASRDDLETSALNLTGVMNQFSLEAKDSERTIHVLAAGAKVGAASISSVGEAMKNFGSVAAGANMSLEQSVAMVEVLGKFSVFGAEAGTKLRGSILKLQQAGMGYKSGQFQINDALTEAKKKIDALKTAKQKDAAVLKMFGAENIATGKIILSNIGLFNEYTKGVTGTNTANEMAAVNTNTLKNVIEEAKAAWVNLITSAEGSSKAMDTAKNAIRFVTNNMSVIVSVGTKVLLFFAGWKAVLIASRIALTAYNGVMWLWATAQAVNLALQGKTLLFLQGNKTAMIAYKVITYAVTAAQWAWNAAMTANPIGLIIVGVAALIGLVATVINKWNEWGAALSIFLGPLGFVISLIQSFRRNWEMITSLFKKGEVLEGFKAIGKVIIDAVLMPIQQVASIIASVTGADWASNAVKAIEAYRKNLGVNVTTDESGGVLPKKELVNPEARRQQAIQQIVSEKTNNAHVKFEVNDPNKVLKAKDIGSNDLIKLKTRSTMRGWSGG